VFVAVVARGVLLVDWITGPPPVDRDSSSRVLPLKLGYLVEVAP
jgi:hypothetical protein